MTAGSIHTEELSCSWTCAAAGSQVLSGSVQVIGAKRKNSVGVRRILTGLLSPILSFPTPTHTDTTPKSTIEYHRVPKLSNEKAHQRESKVFFYLRRVLRPRRPSVTCCDPPANPFEHVGNIPKLFLNTIPSATQEIISDLKIPNSIICEDSVDKMVQEVLWQHCFGKDVCNKSRWQSLRS